MSTAALRRDPLYGCILCQSKRWDRNASLQAHIAKEHPHVTDWKHLKYKWGYRVKQADASIVYLADTEADKESQLTNGNSAPQASSDVLHGLGTPSQAAEQVFTSQEQELSTMAPAHSPTSVVHRAPRIGCRLCQGLHFDKWYTVTNNSDLESSLQRHAADVHPSVSNWETLGYVLAYRIIFADGSSIDKVTDPDSNTVSTFIQQNPTIPLHNFAKRPQPSAIRVQTSDIDSPHINTSSHISSSQIHAQGASSDVAHVQGTSDPRVFNIQTKLGALDMKVWAGEYGTHLQQLVQQAFIGPAADHAHYPRSREDQLLDMIDYLVQTREFVLQEEGDGLEVVTNR